MVAGVDELTDTERMVQDMLMFENWERYTLQSKNTTTGRAAEPPPRGPLRCAVGNEFKWENAR